MELTADAGNTHVKLGVFEGGKLVTKTVFAHAGVTDFSPWLNQYRDIPSIISSVASLAVTSLLQEALPQAHLLGAGSRLPFTSRYETPETLGTDRIAAVAGALLHRPGVNVLVIDAGTCITYELVTAAAVYEGGAIAPGLDLRYRAMALTGRLPDLHPASSTDLPELAGRSTAACMHSGVRNGLVAEVEGIVSRYREMYPDVQVLACGGDSAFLVKHAKCNIFAVPDLVLEGLYHILKINVA